MKHASLTPYESVLSHVKTAAEDLGFSENEYRFLLSPERELTVFLPVSMDDGHTEVFTGYRVQYSSVLGPYKGGIRYHESAGLDQVRSLACEMALKCSLAHIPFGGGKGGIAVNPSRLSAREREILTKKYARAIAPLIGELVDVPAPDVGTDAQCMAWFCEGYSETVGHFVPACVTGKPLELGGSLGRSEATGKGIAIAARELFVKKGLSPVGMTVAIQGNGNVGGSAARALAALGCKIVAVSDVSGAVFCEKGLDAEAVFRHSIARSLLSDYTGEGIRFVPGEEGNKEILSADVDLLVPAALGNQITEENAASVRARYIVEAANGPVSAEADEILNEKGITLVPDILANSGGVVVSYFEWMQNLQKDSWTEEAVYNRLEEKMVRNFDEVWNVAKEHSCSLRCAAYRIAVERIVRAKVLCGNN